MSRIFKLLIVISLSIFAGISHAQNQDWTKDVNCQDQTQLNTLQMKYCAGIELELADKALNQTWAQVKAAMKQVDIDNGNFAPEPNFASKSLLNAQRAWIKYRDGHCEAYAARSMGGTIQPLLIVTCLTEVTQNRTKELQSLIQEGF